MKKLLILFMLAVMLLPGEVHAFTYDGYYSLGFENLQNPGQNSSALVHQLNLNLVGLGVPELAVYAHGQYRSSLHEDESEGDLFLGYVQYRTFQGVTQIDAGRFGLVTNKFMTLDGLQLARITPWNFGVSMYVGAPRYMDFEEKGDEFRMTGDLAYGGKVFLSGISDVQFNVNYYRETGFDEFDRFDIFKETVGFGGSYFYGLNSADNSTDNTTDNIMFELSADQDVNKGVLARVAGRVSTMYGSFHGAIFGDYFDVRDDYPAGRELIIRLLSTGQEKRIGANIDYDLTENINVYGGMTATRVQVRSGDEHDGRIYRLGTDITFVQAMGLSAAFEVYDYESVVNSATGISGNVEWHFTNDFILYVSAEQAWLRDSMADDSAFAFESRLRTYLTSKLTLDLLGQLGSRNRFTDDYRWGGRLRYAF